MSLVRLKVVRADPAGNVTLFVLTPVDRALRADAAGKLIAALPEMKVEQVGFASAPLRGGAARLEMAGGEFCGNAARAWGMWTAREAGRVPPPERVRIEVSGCGHPIAVDVDWVEGTARTEMPLPLEVQPGPEFGGTLVHLGGIAHLVVRDTAPSREFFHRAEPAFVGLAGLEAYGVVFLECLDAAAGEERLTPLVKVPSVGTLFQEGSCGSGSLAAAVAESAEVRDGEFRRRYVQPAGALIASVVRRSGEVRSAFIEGPVSLDEPIEVELDLHAAG